MTPLRKPYFWASLVLGFVKELIVSTAVVVRAVLGDSRSLKPAIVEVPLDAKSDVGIATFANMVTLTPGTTSLEVSEDKTKLFVHALDVDEPKQAANDMKAALESRVLKVLP